MKPKKFPVSGFALLTIVLIIFKSPLVTNAVKSSLELCFSVIIPSLFPFMVMSSQFVGNMKNTPPGFMARVFGHLFGFSSCGMGAFLCGILCGYPIGAKCASQLYHEKKISKSEAQTLIACANNSGPLFIIGAVGSGMLKSLKWGAILYGVHIICSLISALVLKNKTYINPVVTSPDKKEKPLTESISESVVNVLNICGFVVFFSVVNVLVSPLVNILPEVWGKVVFCILEITNGIQKVTKDSDLLTHKLYLTSFALGWSGISVHMQVKSIVKNLGLSMKKYYFAKVMSAIISPLILFTILDLKDALFSTVPVVTLKALVISFGAIGLGTVLIKQTKRKKVM